MLCVSLRLSSLPSLWPHDPFQSTCGEGRNPRCRVASGFPIYNPIIVWEKETETLTREPNHRETWCFLPSQVSDFVNNKGAKIHDKKFTTERELFHIIYFQDKHLFHIITILIQFNVQISQLSNLWLKLFNYKYNLHF